MHLLDITMLYAANSGITRYLRTKRAWLARETTVRHTLLVPAANDGEGVDGETYVRTLAWRASGYRWPLNAPRWTRAVCERKPDLIELGDPGPAGCIGLMAARRLGVPVIAFCHSNVERVVRDRAGPPSARVVREYVAQLYRRCSLVIAPSDYMADQLAEWGVDRVVTRRLGVDLDLFHPRRRTSGLRRALGLSSKTRILIYAGRFAPEKHIDTMLRAFKLLGRSYHLLLLGNGGSVPAQANVTVLPPTQSSTAIARLLASADGLVHAGDRETFGLVLLEAMACGRGVVAAAAGAAPELVTTGTGILVPPRDAQLLAEGVRAFYERDLDAMGRRARTHVERYFDLDETMRGLLGLYRGALGAASPRVRTYAAP
jgi:alpha-1,6-mannosyltransferase